MKASSAVLLATGIGIAATAVFLSSFFRLLATEELRAQTITVVAAVRPLRVITVGPDQVVRAIYSNTARDVRPIVFLNSTDGPKLPYTDAIRKQYGALKPTLNFTRPGLVYERKPQPIPVFLRAAAPVRKTRLIPAFLRAAGQAVGKWLVPLP